ncbi:MAG TPA: response regulator [Bacteroidia bacterium]|nr:response regulator [Bacteroidia bacterium]
MKQRNYKVDLEIYVVFIIVIGISVFNAIYSSVYINRNQEVTTNIMTDDIPSLQALENMNSLIIRSKMYSTNWVYLEGNRIDKEKLKALHKKDYPIRKATIENLMLKWTDAASVDSMRAIFDAFEIQINNQKRVIELLSSHEDYKDPMKVFNAEEIVNNEILPQCTNLIYSLNRVILKKKALAELEHANVKAFSRTLMWSLISLAILIVIVVLIAAFYISTNIILPTMKLRNYVELMGKGEIPEIDLRSRKTAVGQMTDAVHSLKESLMRTADFARNIGAGNFEIEYKPLSEHDELGMALVQMRESLQKANQDNQLRHWMSTGFARINEVLRDNNNDISKLTDEIISVIVKHLHAFHGGIYLIETDEISGEEWIQLHGSFAMDQRLKAKSKLSLGEGLIGQAIKNDECIHLENAPNSYVSIGSGLGEAPASHILIVPLRHRGKVYGAVELASFSPFTPNESQFVENSGETMASTIASVKVNMLTHRLLDETRLQTERLASQEEELRQTNDELSHQSQLLQASEEELKESNLELKANARELEHQNEILEQAREALILKAQELELNNRYKSEFLANMSHELRTPLNSVLILAKLLADNNENNLTTKQVEYAGVIHKSGNDLLLLINDILDLSKIEAGKIDLIMEKTAFKTIKKDTFDLFSEVAKEKKIEFEIEQHSGIPETFITDKVRLEQVIKNLLSNAFKFTPHGGKVIFKIKRPDRRMRFSSQALRNSSNILELSVSDTGIGIPAEKQQLIFNAFQQADGSTSRKYGGTGLGLSISKMLVSLLGGELQLESVPNTGSTFYIFLPMDVQDNKLNAEADPHYTNVIDTGFVDNDDKQSPKLQLAQNTYPIFQADDRDNISPDDKVLLIVENDVAFANALKEMARNKNYKTVIASDGDSGLEYAEAYNPSAIIMDMQVPGKDGLTVLQKIRANEKLSRIPVHVVTASEKKNLLMDLGATACLTKPLDLRDLDGVFAHIDETIPVVSPKVLVIESSVIDKEIIQNLLKTKNNQVIIQTASSSAAAKSLLEQGVFHCIILDLEMEHGQEEGIQLLEDIKSSTIHKDTPVIVFTSNDMNSDEEENIKKWTDAIVLKSGESSERLIAETELFLNKVSGGATNKKFFQIAPSLSNLLKGKKVLLVDDDIRNIYALTSVLENQGMEVTMATNGKDALRKLENQPDVDVVLMDIMMPEIDGYVAIQEIRKVERYRNTPIIAVTAKAMNGDREKCIQCGASDYISKPVSSEQLLSLLRVWLYK